MFRSMIFMARLRAARVWSLCSVRVEPEADQRGVGRRGVVGLGKTPDLERLVRHTMVG
jgi:hypothetical protein